MGQVPAKITDLLVGEFLTTAGSDLFIDMERPVNLVGRPEAISVGDIDHLDVAAGAGVIIAFSRFVFEFELIDQDVEDFIGLKFLSQLLDAEVGQIGIFMSEANETLIVDHPVSYTHLTLPTN